MICHTCCNLSFQQRYSYSRHLSDVVGLLMHAVGPEVNPHMVSLLYPVERNIKAVAVALNKPVR